MSWGVEVEPPEDMDDTDFNIDPRMKIWKGMTGSEEDKQLKDGEGAEEDLDELHHLSMADLLKVQIQKLGALPVPDIQVDPLQESEVDSEEPEQDQDEVYRKVMEELGGYLAPLMADYKAGAEVRVAHSEPEKDEDEVHHHDDLYSPVQIEPLGSEVRGESEVRVRLQPEEDRDDLYHKDVLQPIPYQGDTEAAAPVYVPSQRKHSEPEEDLDHLYHKWSFKNNSTCVDPYHFKSNTVATTGG